MSCLEPLLREQVERATALLRPRLQGLFGAIARGYLPQAWVVIADSEAFTIEVDRAGRGRVCVGAHEHPDVTLRVGHERLRRALAGEPPDRSDPVPYAVTFQSPKGETAFRFLKDRFGLS